MLTEKAGIRSCLFKIRPKKLGPATGAAQKKKENRTPKKKHLQGKPGIRLFKCNGMLRGQVTSGKKGTWGRGGKRKSRAENTRTHSWWQGGICDQ